MDEWSMKIRSIFHVNLNCRDFETSLAFYQALGFEIEMPFPEWGNPLVAKGLGVGEHRVKGALLRLGSGPSAARLDLLEWTSPRNTKPSPLKLTDPGFVRMAFATSDMLAVLQRLKKMGVEFISDPVYRDTPDGPRPMFVCFRDPDGNVLELVNAKQRPRPAATAAAPATKQSRASKARRA